MKKTIIILILILYKSNLYCQIVDQNYKKTIAFMFMEFPLGKLTPIGTGFFISFKRGYGNGDTLTTGNIVTAKHVLKDTKGHYLKTIYIRLNKKEGGSDTLRLNLFDQKGDPFFALHPDTTVDLAILPAIVDFTKYDVLYLTESEIATKEIFDNKKISEGDDAFFLGLFSHHYGSKKNIPITRFGKIALISEEKISWGKTPMDLYLIETTTYGGNSGSPLFFRLGHTRGRYLNLLPAETYLGGIIMGYFNEMKKIESIKTNNIIHVSLENSGIAAVIPAYKIHKLIEHYINIELNRINKLK